MENLIGATAFLIIHFGKVAILTRSGCLYLHSFGSAINLNKHRELISWGRRKTQPKALIECLYSHIDPALGRNA